MIYYRIERDCKNVVIGFAEGTGMIYYRIERSSSTAFNRASGSPDDLL